MGNEYPDWYEPEKHKQDKEYLEFCRGYELEPAEEPLTYKPKERD